MPNYRRNRIAGATYFFTVNLRDRGSRLLVAQIGTLREIVRDVRRQSPFGIDAWVVLPDHMHCLWTLPEGDSDFPDRWRRIKAAFSKSLPDTEQVPRARLGKGERGIWQRGYWEHTIRDDRDFAAHIDDTHFNPAPTLPSPASGGGLGRGRTRRTGHIRHVAGASPAQWIPPTGGAAAINRNRLASGSEIDAAEAGRGARPLHWPRPPIHKSRRNALPPAFAGARPVSDGVGAVISEENRCHCEERIVRRSNLDRMGFSPARDCFASLAMTRCAAGQFGRKLL
jgi:putative transposase